MAISRRQRARCLRDIAIDYNVYSLPGSLCDERPPILVNCTYRGDSVAQAHKSRIGLAACVRYAYACISRDTAVCLNLAKQHHSAWTSFSSILTKMIWIYQHFGGAVSFDRNIGEDLKFEMYYSDYIFYSNIKQKWWKTIPNWKLKKSFRHPSFSRVSPRQELRVKVRLRKYISTLHRFSTHYKSIKLQLFIIHPSPWWWWWWWWSFDILVVFNTEHNCLNTKKS